MESDLRSRALLSETNDVLGVPFIGVKICTSLDSLVFEMKVSWLFETYFLKSVRPAEWRTRKKSEISKLVF